MRGAKNILPARLRRSWSLTLRLSLVLVVPIVTGLIALGSLASFFRDMRGYPELINLAGRQRLLAARMGALVEQAADGHRDSLERIRSRAEEFEEALVLLEKADAGRRSSSWVAAVDRPAEPIVALRRAWDGFRPVMARLVAREGPAGGEPLDRERFHHEVDALILSADAVTADLQHQADTRGLGLLWFLGALSTSSAAVMVLGLMLVRRYVVRPIVAATEAAEAIAGGDFSRRLPVESGDELGRLAVAHNTMAAKVEDLLGQMRRSADEAALLNESLPIGALVVDEQGRVLSSNRALRESFGIPKRTDAPRTLGTLFGDEAALRLLDAARWADRAEALPLELRGAGGRSGVFQVSRLPTRVDAEGREGAVLLFEELTEAARLRDEARAAAMRFQSVLKKATEAIVLTDSTLQITYFNDAAEALFGHRREEMLGKSIDSLLVDGTVAPDPADPTTPRPSRTAASMLLSHSDSGSRVTYEALRADGRRVPVELTVSPYGEGEHGGVTLILRDVTERRAAERAIRRSEASFRALIEGSPDAVGVSRAGILVYANQQFVEGLGYAALDDMVGRSSFEFVHPDEHAPMRARMQSIWAKGEPVPPAERRMLRRDGRVVTWDLAAIPVVFEGEDCVAVVGRDVSARVELTAKMMEVDRMVAVGTLAAGVGHEINNPLAYILANLDYLDDELETLLGDALDGRRGAAQSAHEAPSSSAVAPDGEVPAEVDVAAHVRQVLDELRDGAERVRDVVQTLRDLSEPQDRQRATVQLDRVLRRALTTTRRAIQLRAHIETDFSGYAWVEGDEGRLLQVAVNLLMNATHAIPEGAADRHRVQLRTGLRGRQAYFEVEDSGAGMSSETLRRVFDPFFTTKPVGQGTGLGLSLSRQIVRAHGGEIEIESREGEGTTVRVLLPMAEKVDALASTDPPSKEHILPAEGAGVSAWESGAAARARILVVDDEVTICHTIERVLGKLHDVVSEHGGASALERLRRGERFDVVLCDLMMPDVTGMDLFEELERLDARQAERVLFITGGAFSPRAAELCGRFPDRCVTKPFRAHELRARVDAMVQHMVQHVVQHDRSV